MGKRADALDALLRRTGLEPIVRATPKIVELPAEEQKLIRNLFDSLGGIGAQFARTRTGGWDLSYEGGLTIELDEEHHFNRFRLRTLEGIGDRPWSARYREYCATFEARVGKGGGWWTNSSCERMFGPSSPPGDLGPPGPARWKQRAFYDAVKDVQSRVGFARVSIYDVIDDRPLGSVLAAARSRDAAAVLDLVLSRVHPVPTAAMP